MTIKSAVELSGEASRLSCKATKFNETAAAGAAAGPPGPPPGPPGAGSHRLGLVPYNAMDHVAIAVFDVGAAIVAELAAIRVALESLAQRPK